MTYNQLIKSALREVIVVPRPLDRSLIGKVIAQDINSINNVLLVKEGTVLTESLIERLKKNNIAEVELQVEEDTVEQKILITENGQLSS